MYRSTNCAEARELHALADARSVSKDLPHQLWGRLHADKREAWTQQHQSMQTATRWSRTRANQTRFRNYKTAAALQAKRSSFPTHHVSSTPLLNSPVAIAGCTGLRGATSANISHPLAIPQRHYHQRAPSQTQAGQRHCTHEAPRKHKIDMRKLR